MFARLPARNRMFNIYCSAEEPQIIEYQTQQYKLFPFLATAYAYWFAGRKLRKAYVQAYEEIMKGDAKSLPEVWYNTLCC
jgi:acyl-CoA oxidase